MPKLLIELALDRYGAETLGRMFDWLDDLATGEELHLAVWGGPGAPPRRADYWSHAYPPWDEAAIIHPYDEAKHGGGLDVDRQQLALDVAAATASEQGRTIWRQLLIDRPVVRLGRNVPIDDVALIIVGSLADPITSATLLGVLSGLARLRKIGVISFPIYNLIALGVDSGPEAANIERTRALVARGLLDLQEFIAEGEAGSPHRLSSCIAIGEEKISGAPSNRDVQVALGAIAVAGISRSVVSGHKAAEPLDAPSPLQNEFTADGRLYVAGEVFDPTTPFSAMGGYAVYCPATRLTDLLAITIAERAFDALLKQEIHPTIDEAARVVLPSDIVTFLEEVEGRAIERTWRKVTERDNIPWEEVLDSAKGATLSWFDLDRVKRLYQAIFESSDWKKVVDAFGETRLNNVALEDWNSAIDELTQITEEGVLKRRKAWLSAKNRIIATAMLDSIDESLGNVFDRTYQPPVGARPHGVSAAFLGRIYKHLKNRQEQQQMGAFLNPLAARSPKRPLLANARARLRDELAAIPSPAAVLVRIAPVLIGIAVFVLAFPFHLGRFDTPPMRLFAGAILGLLAISGVFFREVHLVRQRVFEVFRRWHGLYRQILVEEDDIEKDRAGAELIEAMIACTEWRFQGRTPHPPLPESIRINIERPRTTPPVEPPDTLSGQTVLSDFSGYLKDARDHFRSLRERMLRDFQVSYVETLLPEIRPDRAGLLDTEIAALFDRPDPDRAVVEIRDWYRSLPTADPALFPFAAEPPETTKSVWRRSFRLPDGTDLLSELVRHESSAFSFFTAVRAFVRAHGEFDLATRINAEQHEQSMSRSPLYSRYANFASLSIAQGAEFTSHYVVAAGRHDALAANLDRRDVIGTPSMSIHMQVLPRIDANRLIFYPSPFRPTNALGLSWLASTAEGWQDKALQTVKMPEETRG